MNCTNCGKQLSKHLNYCIHCGNPVSKLLDSDLVSQTETVEPIASKLLTNKEVENISIPNILYTNVQPVPKNHINKKKLTFWIVLIFLIAIFIALFVILKLSIFKKNSNNNAGIENIENQATTSKVISASPSNEIGDKSNDSSPFYIINVAAYNLENDAVAKADQIRNLGYPTGHLWIPDFPSLSGAKMFSTFIGPFNSQYECEVATEKYRKIDPTAYGILVSNEPIRIQINGIGKIVRSNNPQIISGAKNGPKLCSTIENNTEVVEIKGENVRVRTEANSSSDDNIMFKLGRADTPLFLTKQTVVGNY